MIQKKKEKIRQVSAFPAIFKVDFGHFSLFRPFWACFGHIGRQPIRPDMADTARFWPNQPGSAWIEADSARIKPHWRKSSRVGANPRKKKSRCRPTRGQPRRTRVRHQKRSCFLAHYKTRNCGFNCNHSMAHLDSSGQKPIVGKNHTAGKYWWSYEELAAAISVKSGGALLWEVASPTQMVTTRTGGV